MKIEILLFLGFLFSCFFVFAGIDAVIVKGLSYDINRRYLNFRLVIATFLLAVLSATPFISYYALMIVDGIINIPFLSAFFSSILPNRAFELIYIVLCVIGLNLLYSLSLVVVLSFTRALFANRENYVRYSEYDNDGIRYKLMYLPWFIVNKFYDTKDGNPALTSRGYFLGVCFKRIKWIFAVIVAAELLTLYVSVLWGPAWWNEVLLSVSKALYLLPMAAYLLTEQLQLFLEGPEPSESGSLGVSDIEERKIGDMTSLMYRYAVAFSDSDILLYDEIGDSNTIEGQGLAGNDLGNQQLADCNEPEILSVLSNQLRMSEVQQTPGFQNAIISLLNGNAVNVRDCIDGEFVQYLFVYLNYYISRGFSAIVICADEEEKKRAKNSLERQKTKQISINCMWSVNAIADTGPSEHCGVILCTAEELVATSFNSKYDYLLADIFCAVVLNSSAVMSLDIIRIEKIFSRFKTFPNLSRYVFLSQEDNESLRAKIKQNIPKKTELLSFNNDNRQPKTNIMVWKEESIYKPQTDLGIGNASSPCMGTAFPLALIAAKYDLDKAYIVPAADRGDLYFSGSAQESNYADILNYLEKSIDLKSVIRYSATEPVAPMDMKMLILYDTDYNFLNALWKWFKYSGNNGTLIHIVSPHYMMREYFAANIRRKARLYANNEFRALIPGEAVLKRNLLATILTLLADTGLTVDELMNYSHKYGWSYANYETLIKDALLTVRTRKEHHSVYEHIAVRKDAPVFDKKQNKFVQPERITLFDTNILHQQKAQLSLARLSYKTNEYLELPVLSGNIWNYYLPKQIFAYRGMFYSVTTVDADNGIVHAVPTNPDSVPDYYTLCGYTLSRYSRVDECVDNSAFDCNICEATASKTIYGYVASNNGNCFSGEIKPTVNLLNGINEEYRTVTLEHVPVLEINFYKNSIADFDDPEKIVSLLCVILNGLFKTLFPKTHQNIVALPDRPLDKALIDRIFVDGEGFSARDIIRSMISGVEISGAKAPLDCVKLYIIEFSCIEYGTVKAIYNNIEKLFRMVRDYLGWYLASNRDTGAETVDYIKGRYLHFGFDAIPDMFAPDSLYGLLGNILNDNTGVETVTEPNLVGNIPVPEESIVTCSFCDREIGFGWRLSDKRYMCAHCHDHQKTQKEEITRLFNEIKKMLESNYHISFRKNINVHFQTAENIRKATGGTDNGRVVGFYSHGNRQLWIETRGPAVAMKSTIIHELTHAWQHDALPLSQLERSFPREVRRLRLRLLLEGHAAYVELNVMEENGEVEYARRLKNKYLVGDDIYSIGYRLIAEQFRIMEEFDRDTSSYFKKMEKLVKNIIDGEVSIPWPEGY